MFTSHFTTSPAVRYPSRPFNREGVMTLKRWLAPVIASPRFRNPTNGYIERPDSPILFSLLLGPL
jgi:hypothetical protein